MNGVIHFGRLPTIASERGSAEIARFIIDFGITEACHHGHLMFLADGDDLLHERRDLRVINGFEGEFGWGVHEI